MNEFTITINNMQANLIFAALHTHAQTQQNIVNELMRYIDSEFLKANPNLQPPKPAEDEAKVEQTATF